MDRFVTESAEKGTATDGRPRQALFVILGSFRFGSCFEAKQEKTERRQRAAKEKERLAPSQSKEGKEVGESRHAQRANSTCSCRLGRLLSHDAFPPPTALPLQPPRFCSAQITGPLLGFPTKEFRVYLQNLTGENMGAPGISLSPSEVGMRSETLDASASERAAEFKTSSVPAPCEVVL